MADTNFAQPAILTEQSSAATPPANTVALYPKTDGRFYGKDDAGTEFAIGTIGGTTGTVDNAVPRADGTGGGTLQGSDIVIDDATTSTQNNVAIVNNHVGQTNSALVLTPKGTGALIAGPKPDGTTTGGNARGTRAVDLQMLRSSASNVASGAYSVICGGQNNRVSGNYSFLGTGETGNVLSGGYSFMGAPYACTISVDGSAIVAGGFNAINAGSGDAFIGGGRANLIQATGGVIAGGGNASGTGIGNTVSAFCGSILGGIGGLANRYGMQAHANGAFNNTSGSGDAQRARFVLRCKTTTNAAVEMALDGSTTYLGIPSGKVIACTINISGVKSDGSAVAHYVRQYAVKNVGGTSSEVYAPVTIGTDNAAGTVIALSANNTDDTLRIAVTGIAAETWRWVASVDAVEIAYGT